MHEKEVLEKEKELMKAKKEEETVKIEIIKLIEKINAYHTEIKEKGRRITELEKRRTAFKESLDKVEDWPYLG